MRRDHDAPTPDVGEDLDVYLDRLIRWTRARIDAVARELGDASDFPLEAYRARLRSAEQTYEQLLARSPNARRSATRTAQLKQVARLREFERGLP